VSETGHVQFFIRNRIAASLLLMVLLTPGLVFAQEAKPQTLLVLDHVNVVNVTNGSVAMDRAVIIDGHRIEAVAASRDAWRLHKAGLGSPKGARDGRQPAVMNCKGLYLIPGLWDMHVHLEFGDWFPDARDITLPLLVANGVTGVRDMGSDLETVQAWRAEISAGRLLGPKIITAGPMLDGPKPRFPSSMAIATPEDGRNAVEQLMRRGADFIKFQSLIPRDAVFAILDRAKQRGIAVAGHVPDAVRASEMSDAGMKSFEHLIGIFEGSSEHEDDFLKGDKNVTKLLAGYDPNRALKLAALLAKNNTWQCPTLVWERGGNLLDQTDFAADKRVKYVPDAWRTTTWKRFEDEIRQGYAVDDLSTRKKFVAKELEVVALLHRAGVPFLAGTDTPPGVYIFPGFSLHEELERFVDAGFTPLEALQTATLNAARFLSLEEHAGVVEPGKDADLVLLQANPIDSIANTKKVFAVVVNGRFMDRQALDKILTGVEIAARSH
jgi:imidazolonepropionase-like amidohydrolase